ncbi:daptide biosynthesis RiPP recognition protein [Streptomyces sp. NPDC051569]|uniref:daptide biosynthesis RiPP recognition protein n=1 Tax=Streptomyces sp. NPDC051569 TaxID=3365661 RepID=UPI0037B487E6
MDRSERRRIKQHIMSWGTGTHRPAATPGGAAATIALADREHLAAVIGSGLTGPGTVVLAPGDDDAASGVVGYDGFLAEPGADFSIGDDFYLQTQDYASSAFMSVLGPTLIRITDRDDFALFLADADRAVAEGVFPDFAVAPSVCVADAPALGAGRGIDGAGLRLHVDADGTVSTSPSGSPLGTVGTPFAELAGAWERINAAGDLPCGVCLGAAVPESERVTALLARPYTGRYLTAVDALRTMTVNDVAGVRVSGFGDRITPGLTAAPVAGAYAADLLDPALPVVLWNDERAYVFEPTAGRVFTVDRVSARAVESLLVTGSASAAAGYVPAAAVAKVERFFAGRGVSLAGERITAGAR